MKLSELRAILELSQLSHPGNNVLECVEIALAVGEDSGNTAWLIREVNIATVRDLLPADAHSDGKGTMRLTWEPD